MIDFILEHITLTFIVLAGILMFIPFEKMHKPFKKGSRK
jgi:hypothetical protein